MREMSASTRLPFSVLGEFAQNSAAQPTSQSAGRPANEANAESVAVSIGVLEVPIGVWGSRRVESDSGQSERVEVFAEDTCTVIVFPQGAVIRLSASVAPGQLVVIANRKSGQIMLCRIVNVRTYPHIRGYAELEFMHSAAGFWGAYASQGTLTLAAKVASAMPSASADFWSNGFLKDAAAVPPSAAASAVTASAAGPAVGLRTEIEPTAKRAIQIPFGEGPVEHRVLARTSSLRASSPAAASLAASSQDSARFRIGSWIFSWGRMPSVRTVTDRTPAPKRNLVLVSLVPAVVLLGVAGAFLLRDGVGQPAGISQTAPMPEVSLGSPIANVGQSPVHGPQAKSDATFVVPQLPIAKADNFPGAQARDFADNVRPSHPSERRRPSPRSATSEKKITKEKLLAPYSSASRLAVMSRDAAPDVRGVDSSAGVSPLQGVLATLPRRGGEAKAPELLVRSAPIYPTMARQARVEGQVVIDAVIDATGKLTNMTVISGPPLLQQAAIDSLRTWKYRPGYLNEKPISTKTSITVNFRLR